MTNENTEAVKSTSKSSILFWILGIGLFFSGIADKSILYIISGIVILPITSKIAHKYFKKEIPNWARIAIVVFLIILSMGSSPESPKEVATNNAIQTVSYKFNVPSLVGKDLIELESTLGTPTTYTEPTQIQIDGGVDTWEKTWSKDKVILMVTYDIKTKDIIDLFIGGDFKDTKSILESGNLSTTNNTYSVEFVKARNGTGYTGAIIKKK